jgi:hypothetical protein
VFKAEMPITHHNYQSDCGLRHAKEAVSLPALYYSSNDEQLIIILQTISNKFSTKNAFFIT